MHNGMVGKVLDGLFAARASGSRQSNATNEILRDIPPRRGVLPVPGPARAGPGEDERTGEARE